MALTEMTPRSIDPVAATSSPWPKPFWRRLHASLGGI